MIETDIIDCLRRIEANISSDKYEMLGVWTVGGANNTYSLKGPANTEAEFALYGISASGACNILVSQNQFGNALATNGSASYGTGGGNESNALEGQFYVVSAATPFTPTGELYWQPVGRGSSIYVQIGGLAGGSSAFVLVAWRRLLNRYIPTPPRQTPRTHSLRQSNHPQRILAAESPMMAGFKEGRNVIPGGPAYDHNVTPAATDPAAESRGIAAPLTPAQIVLAKLRGKQGMY